MVYRNTTIRGILPPSTKEGGGGAPSQEGWAPATQGPMGLLIITLITLLTVYIGHRVIILFFTLPDLLAAA